MRCASPSTIQTISPDRWNASIAWVSHFTVSPTAKLRSPLTRSPRNASPQTTVFLKPHTIERQESPIISSVIELLVINHPHLSIRPIDHAVMPRSVDPLFAMRDGVARKFLERSHRQLRRRITNSVIRRVRAGARVHQIISSIALEY